VDAVRHSVPSMSNPDRGDPALCRVVELEWDRGHDKFEAIVRARTDAGIVVTQLHDLVALEGLTLGHGRVVVVVGPGGRSGGGEDAVASTTTEPDEG